MAGKKKKSLENKEAESLIPNTKKNGLIDVQFNNGKIYEMHPDLAKKMIDRKVAQYL